jgi:MFS family permease
MRKVGRAGITYGWRRPAVRLLVLESFLLGGFFSWAWYAWQPYFLQLYGRDAIWLSGVIAAFFGLAGIAGSVMVGRLAKPGRRRTTILLGAAGAFSATMIATGAIRSFWITVPVFLLGAVAGGIMQPVRQTYLHYSIPTSERATLVSFDSLVGSLGSVGGQTGLGYLSQERSIPLGFVVGGLATLLALPIFGRLRALDEPADRITAEIPEHEASPVGAGHESSGAIG